MPQDLPTLALIGAVFVLAGGVKGVVGMGLPTVAMGLLGLAMPPVQAAATLVVPSLVTNLWQTFSGPALVPLSRRLWPLLAGTCAGTALGIGLLTSGSTRWPGFALGAVLAVYAVAGLVLRRLAVPARLQRGLAPVVGVATGALTGATGVFVFPAVPYLSALGFDRDELVQALGLSFTVSTLALAAALAATGSYPSGVAVQSALAVVPALVGMRAGRALRERLDPQAFRRGFFAAMLAVGGYMVVRAL